MQKAEKCRDGKDGKMLEVGEVKDKSDNPVKRIGLWRDMTGLQGKTEKEKG